MIKFCHILESSNWIKLLNWIMWEDCQRTAWKIPIADPPQSGSDVAVCQWLDRHGFKRRTSQRISGQTKPALPFGSQLRGLPRREQRPNPLQKVSFEFRFKLNRSMFEVVDFTSFRISFIWHYHSDKEPIVELVSLGSHLVESVKLTQSRVGTPDTISLQFCCFKLPARL